MYETEKNKLAQKKQIVIVIVMTIAWFFLCSLPVFWLVSHQNYQNNVEFGVGYATLLYIVTFPIGIVTSILLDISGIGYSLSTDIGSFWFWIRWIMLSLAGYVQWVIILTAIAKLLRKRRNSGP